MQNLKKIYFVIEQFLPAQLKKSIFNLWMNSNYRRKQQKTKALTLKAKKKAAIEEFGTFNSKELIKVLRNLGVRKGYALFVQSSYNDLYTFDGASIDIISALLEVVGATGTLFMPAYTSPRPEQIIDLSLEPTNTGIVNEIFRRSEGVIRSLHPRHSICGKGPIAAEILAGHDACIRADGPDSPFDRLRQRDDAFILTLGLPPAHLSFLHWLEDFEPEKLPFSVHKSNPVYLKIKTSKGKVITVPDNQVQIKIATRLSIAKIFALLSNKTVSIIDYKGSKIALYSMKSLAKELIALRDRGIIHYH